MRNNKKLTQINYTALNNFYLFKIIPRVSYVLIMSLFTAFFFASDRKIDITIILVIISTLVILRFALKKIISGASNEYWAQFAQDNNWKLTNVDDISNFIPPIVIKYGCFNHEIGPIIDAKIEGNSFYVYSLKFFVGNEDDFSKEYNYKVIRINLDKYFPQIILDNHRSNTIITGFASEYGLVEIELEGDFSKYFKVFIERNDTIDALSILSPDVMQTILSTNKLQDIEINGKYIYFINDSESVNPKDIRIFINSVFEIYKEMQFRSKTYNALDVKYKKIEYKKQVSWWRILIIFARSNPYYTIIFLVIPLVFIIMLLISLI